ncbi:hypothetical protein WQ59_23285 [Streptomyces sp. KE1]|nr:hypothetical protein WQ59_23285 [Streptomyces sp. KE1]
MFPDTQPFRLPTNADQASAETETLGRLVSLLSRTGTMREAAAMEGAHSTQLPPPWALYEDFTQSWSRVVLMR